MKRKRYSLRSSVLHLVSGLLHFILMFFGYANEFTGLSISHMRELYSVYGSIRFGDTAIGSYLCGVAEQCGQAGKLTFFATLSTVFMLISMILALGVSVHGAFGLIKALAHVDMTPAMRDAAFERRASLWGRLYQISVWLSVGCLTLACVMNFHKLGNKTCCVLPGLGMILLFLAVTVEFILLCVFNRKSSERRRKEAAENVTSECPSCEAHVSPGTLFCPVCGVRLPSPAAPSTTEDTGEDAPQEAPLEPEATPFPYSKYLGVFARAMEEIREGADRKGISRRTVSVLSTLCVVLMIVSAVLQVALLFTFMPQKQLASPMENDISPLYSDAGRDTQVLTDGYILSDAISGSILETTYALDGNTAMLRSYSDKEYKLHICRGRSLQLAASTPNLGQYLSADGSALAYISRDRQLTLYDVKTQSVTEVAHKPYNDFVLSPDGDSVLYCVGGDNTIALYAYVEGKTHHIGDDQSPIAISNGGKYVYYYDQESNGVCVRKANGETAVLATAEGKNRSLVYYLNEDHTEIIFSLSDEVYYARKGGEAALLSTGGIKVMGDFTNWCRVSGTTLPIDSFAGQYFTDKESKLYYIGKNDVVTTVDQSVNAFSAALTGDVAYYVTISRDLYRVESRNPEKAIKVASDVAAYILSPDGRHCYYLDTLNNFWYVKDDAKPRFIAANVLMGTVTREGYGLFVILNKETRKHTLYAARGAGRIYVVQEDVASVTATYNRAYYFVAVGTEGKYTTYEIYAASYGLNFHHVRSADSES